MGEAFLAEGTQEQSLRGRRMGRWGLTQAGEPGAREGRGGHWGRALSEEITGALPEQQRAATEEL